ncbi:MAG: hypothetical protein ACLQVI_13105, partial [Polyangiaceae bacterium]
IGVGVGGAGVVAGTITGILSISKKSSLKTECPNMICGPTGDSTLSSATTLATVSDISFAFAGAGVVLVVEELVRTRVGGPPAAAPAEPASASALSVAPWIAGGAAGIHGTF